MSTTTEKVSVGLYLLLLSAGLVSLLIWLLVAEAPPRVQAIETALKCAVIGGLGGCLYCFRGMYLNISVRDQWNRQWIAWYLIRPLASIGCGAISYVFLRAGLLILEAGNKPDASQIGYFALSFIAGLNVDKFLNKLEEVAQSVWGIEKSHISSDGMQKDHPARSIPGPPTSERDS